MEKKIEDYLHLYYNSDCRTPYGVWKDKFLKSKVHTALYFKEKDVKLYLRPLSDKTPEEREKSSYMGGLHESCQPWEFRYLLSRDFDIFGLIESGLAIDKTNMPV